jgi:UDP-N-acetylmuramoyl-L-alanyl-D-glutamate--2,6-diaminopimelate ligase
MNKDVTSLLEILSYEQCIGKKEAIVDAVSLDSRKVTDTTIFIAQKGETADGHDFIDAAIEKGCRVVVCESLPFEMNDAVTYIQVKDSHAATGIIASWFYDFPTHDLTVIGVTGTNGKTTVATLLWQAFRLLGQKTGLVSTVSYWIDDKEIPSTHTTPDAITLQKLLRNMVDNGCSHVVMEVSSHAIAQKRIAGITFKVGIFTNLTQDHLDFHKTMENYRDTKKKFFTFLPTDAIAITNSDDENGLLMIEGSVAKKITYSLTHEAEYAAKEISLSTHSTTFVIEDSTVTSLLIGSFNLSNSLAVYATLRELGYEKNSVISLFAKLVPPPGRFEVIKGPEEKVAIVDYAHTPDGLEKLLTTIQEMKKEGTSVIVVFGCGGDRDRTKRPLMGAIAGAHADNAIITSDNPRSEVPEAICAEVATGITDPAIKYEIIVDRKDAIVRAVQISNPGDTIVVAGKGHEDYQIIGDQKNHFSDQEILLESFGL